MTQPSQSVHIEILTSHRDPRGFVFEPLPFQALPHYKNVHVVVSEPGAVRGNHYHVHGAEVTSVAGPSLVRYREAGTVQERHIPSGEVWRITFPAGVAHAFRNEGDRPAVLCSFNTEEHDRAAPDVVRDVLIEALG